MATKKKANLTDVKVEAARFWRKPLFKAPYVEQENVPPLCVTILHKFNNIVITIQTDAASGPYVKIVVNRFITGGELIIPIVDNGKHHRTKENLSWIDQFEEWDAIE